MAGRINVANRANVVGMFGAGGSGKSEQIKREVRAAKPARLLIWDPEHEYADPASPHGVFGQVVTSLETVRTMLVAAGAHGQVSIVYRPSDNAELARKQFDVFCRLAFAAGNLTMICEELAFVTKPSWAPEGWARCTLRGRKRGLTIYGASQRPAAVDKNFFGNATRIRTGRLNYEEDRKTMCNVLGVGPMELAQMEPLQWVERDMSNGQVSKGMLTFGAEKQQKTAPAAKKNPRKK